MCSSVCGLCLVLDVLVLVVHVYVNDLVVSDNRLDLLLLLNAVLCGGTAVLPYTTRKGFRILLVLLVIPGRRICLSGIQLLICR